MSEFVTDRPVRTGELTTKIWNHFGPGYVKLTQVRAATGWADLNTADMMVMGEWPSTGNELHGFEIKVSRSDWLNEVKNPHKNDSVKGYCDRWWLVIADESMVKPGELPDDWGMMAFQGRGRKLKVVKKAPVLDAQPMDHCFVASLLRHNDKEMIPIDVHRDALRDEQRQAEADLKKKTRELFDFVRVLSGGFGIQIKEQREYDYTKPGRAKVFSRWKAAIKKTYLGELTAPEVAELLRKAALVDNINSEVAVMRRNLKSIIDKAEDSDDVEVRHTAMWANYALKNCQTFLLPKDE